MKLHFDVHPGQGPPCLLVHGMLSSRAQWSLNLAALSTLVEPVVVELWGHGRSPSPREADRYTPDSYVAEIEQLRRELGADRWFLIGQSFGAALTLRYALEYPERVIAGVFTNSASALADEEWGRQVRESAEVVARQIEEGGIDAIEQMPIHPRHAKRLPGEAHRLLLEDAKRLDPRGVANTLRHCVPETPLRERLKENRTPTLLICGDREESFAPIRRLAESRMPNLEVVRLDAGHAVNMQAADDFNRAVKCFFARQGDNHPSHPAASRRKWHVEEW